MRLPSPCIPQDLPLKSLRKDRFLDLLPKAYQVLDCFNWISLVSFEKLKKTMFSEELKCSSRLPKEALDFLLEKHPISLRLLPRLHRYVQRPSKVVSLQDIGKIRNRQNWIGPEGRGEAEAYFYPPNLTDLKKGLKNLQEYFRRNDEDPLVQAAIYFAQFLILHPFMDGNGRVARLLIPLFLYEKKVIFEPLFLMSHYFKKRRVDYFHKLYEISSKQKWEEWIRFFLKGIIYEGKRMIESFE